MRNILFLSVLLWQCVFSNVWAIGDLLPKKDKLWIGKKILNYTLPNLAQEQIKIENYRSQKPLLLVMGRSDCPFCTLFLQLLLEFVPEYEEKGMAFLYVSFDQDLAEIQEYVQKNAINFLTLSDKKEYLADYYGVSYVPAVIVTNQEGKIIHFAEGAFGRESLLSILQQALP